MDKHLSLLLMGLALLCAHRSLGMAPLYAQSNEGELRLTVDDPSGLGVRATVDVVSDANHYRTTFSTDDGGRLTAKRLPFGVYRVEVRAPGFAPATDPVEIRSALPLEHAVSLRLAEMSASVTVSAEHTLIDPNRPGAVNIIGTEAIENRPTSLPGRSMQDLVNSQPGWLYEGNAVLHPRGSEYQTQVVLDGIPLIDNRSPGSGPEIDADDVESLRIYTAGFPAEYGRQLGGVIEVNTLKETQAGLHGQVVISGGSFDTVGSSGQAQYVRDGNTLGVAASGSSTDHYLNPVVPENYTNRGTTGDFSLNYAHDFSSNDRVSLIVRHAFSRFEIPNEQVQEDAGQRQDANNAETLGILSFRHVFSSNVVTDIRGMVRSHENDLSSNPSSTPVMAFLHNWFREGYIKANVSVHEGRQEWKVGIESDNLFLHEAFSDVITDPTQFDDGTPTTFTFAGSHPELDQAVYVQDLVRLGDWTASVGLRWDHYQLLVAQQALSPRLSLARSLPAADLVLHASYDRVFQTPSFQNILLSSSRTVESLNPNVLRLPVLPSHGTYIEGGLSKAFSGKLRLDANVFRRQVNNYADDDQLLNTAVSFPIAFSKAVIQGAEGKLDLVRWGRLSGYVSYSYTVGNAWFPVTGGLFVGDAATNAMTQLGGRFPDSQDQRHTGRIRLQYQMTPRVWIAGGGEYGSGLPFDFAGSYQDAVMEYGQQVVNRVDFNTSRVRPSLSLDAAVSTDLYRKGRVRLRLQGDAQNLNNRLNVIDFNGLFSGNAIGPPRSYGLRLSTSF
jgi:outer membrane cobalamin receptor